MVTSQHGKANLHSQRAGSQVPKERKRVLRHRLQPASPSAALRSVWVGHLLRKAVRQQELPSSNPTSSLQVAVALCDVARIRTTSTSTPPVPPSTCCFSVSLPHPRDYKAPAHHPSLVPAKQSIHQRHQPNPLRLPTSKYPTRQELRSGDFHWGSSRQTLRRPVQGGE